jgi:hypothetical protein
MFQFSKYWDRPIFANDVSSKDDMRVAKVVRVPVALSREEIEQIDAHRLGWRLPDRATAAREIFLQGLAAVALERASANQITDRRHAGRTEH